MRKNIHFSLKTGMWILALATAFASARYFFARPPLLERSQILAFSRHQFWILLHVAGGIVAIAMGPLQFVRGLRAARPALHRAIGYSYLAAVLLAGCAGFKLSPDTPIFIADALTDFRTRDFSFLGLSPSFLGYGPSSSFSPNQFFLVMAGFETLAAVWLLTTASAFVRARQRRLEAHRAWMMRSYSLTFAAATVRLVGLPFLVLTRDPVIAITCTFWSWTLNLIVAELLIRRGSEFGGGSPGRDTLQRDSRHLSSQNDSLTTSSTTMPSVG